MKTPIKQLLAAAAVALLSAQAQAGTVACPLGPIDDSDRDFQLTTAVDSSCLAYGDGNILGQIGQGDAFTALFPSYVALDKDVGDAIIPEGSFTVSGLELTGGVITLAASLWDSYSALAVGFKAGNSNTPDWAVFGLATGTTTGTFLITPDQGGGLSHANLYGIAKANPGGGGNVPEPGSVALVSAALLAIGATVRRRRQDR